MKNKTTRIFLASLLISGLFLVVNTVWATPGDICFKPNVPIPGMSAIFGQDSSTTCSDGGYLITPDSIGYYVKALYTYAARLAVAIAMFMIVFASWQWMMAAGNASKVDNAKDTIQGALIGLALLFAGQLLLNNISSKLVSFEGLNLPSIDPIAKSGVSYGTPEDPCLTITTAQECESTPYCMLSFTKIFYDTDGSTEIYGGKCIGVCPSVEEIRSRECNASVPAVIPFDRTPTEYAGSINSKPDDYLTWVPGTVFLKTAVSCRGIWPCSSEEKCIVAGTEGALCLWGDKECQCVPNQENLFANPEGNNCTSNSQCIWDTNGDGASDLCCDEETNGIDECEDREWVRRNEGHRCMED